MIPAAVRIFVCVQPQDIFVCVQPQDMRRSFDMLALAAQQIGVEQRSGALFVFTNRRRNQLKVLWWDRNGYCLLYKRLHRALFRPPGPSVPEDSSVQIDRAVLGELLAGVTTPRRRVDRA